jgi:hypothetical protein
VALRLIFSDDLPLSSFEPQLEQKGCQFIYINLFSKPKLKLYIPIQKTHG